MTERWLPKHKQYEAWQLMPWPVVLITWLRMSQLPGREPWRDSGSPVERPLWGQSALTHQHVAESLWKESLRLQSGSQLTSANARLRDTRDWVTAASWSHSSLSWVTEIVREIHSFYCPKSLNVGDVLYAAGDSWPLLKALEYLVYGPNVQSIKVTSCLPTLMFVW